MERTNGQTKGRTTEFGERERSDLGLAITVSEKLPSSYVRKYVTVPGSRNKPGLPSSDIGASFSLSESESLWVRKRDCPDFPFFFSSIPPEQSWSRVGSAKGCLISPPLACAAEDYPVTYGAIEMLGKEGKNEETERNGGKKGKRCGGCKNCDHLFGSGATRIICFFTKP